MNEILEMLRCEFDAEPGSFLLQLRCDLRWDRESFERLTGTMHSLVRGRHADEPIPRWIAEGFWYLDWFVRDWSSHPDFPREHDGEYDDRAYERLHDLASWLFTGESPYDAGSGFDPL